MATVPQTAQSEVQQAIWKVLNPNGVLDTTLAGLGITGVFDETPPNTAFDYITFGPTLEGPDNTFGLRGYDLVMHMDIWTQKPGFKNAQATLARMNQLLDQQVLPLATHTHIYTMYDQSQPLREPDGLTRHLSVRYKIMTQE